MVDRGRDVMAIGAAAEKERHRAGGDVLRRHAAERALDLQLALRQRQIDKAVAPRGRGTSVNKSSIDSTPIAASMSRRSASVSGR